MYYLDLTFHSNPPEIRGVSIDTQSMNTAVQRMGDWINGYRIGINSVQEHPDLPEIERISRTKSRGVDYVRLEDLR